MDINFNSKTFGEWFKKLVLGKVDNSIADLKSLVEDIFGFLKAFGVGGNRVQEFENGAKAAVASLKEGAESLSDVTAKKAAELAAKAAKEGGVTVSDAQTPPAAVATAANAPATGRATAK